MAQQERTQEWRGRDARGVVSQNLEAIGAEAVARAVGVAETPCARSKAMLTVCSRSDRRMGFVR